MHCTPTSLCTAHQPLTSPNTTHTAPAKDMNYEQTLLAVRRYADEAGLPFRYVLLDSWWYYR